MERTQYIVMDRSYCIQTGRRMRRRVAWVFGYVLTTISVYSSVACAEEIEMTLQQAIRMSLNTPSIRVAREAVNQADAELHSAFLAPNPTLLIEGGMLPLSRGYSVHEPGGPSEFSGEISYPIDWAIFGKRKAAAAGAKIGTAAARDELADVLRLRAAETAEAYFRLMETNALWVEADLAENELGKTVDAIKKSVDAGGRPPVELNRVLLEWHSAKREARDAKSDMIAAAADLSALLGISEPSATAIKPAETLDGPILEKTKSVEEAYSLAWTHRSDISAMKKYEDKARQDCVIEKRNALPESTMGISVTHQFQQNIGAPDVTAWGVFLEMELPLFDRNQGERKKAASLKSQINLAVTAAKATLLAEVKQAVAALNKAVENAREVTQEELTLASQVRESVEKAYAAGGCSLLEMLDAQRAYRESYRAYITSRAEYLRSLFRYESVIEKRKWK